MSATKQKVSFTSSEIASLFSGKSRAVFRQLEEVWGISITARGDWVEVAGEDSAKMEEVVDFFSRLDQLPAQGIRVYESDVQRYLQWLLAGKREAIEALLGKPFVLTLRRKTLVPKTLTQKRYLQSLIKDTIVFGIGPAGTGKTYLAVAAALHALLSGEVKRIVLTRPAVEAGEALGFLPGDLTEKILPYLRPLYDSLYDLIGKTDTEKMIERGVLEIAPLAYMRGRTLDHCYVILDEAQNTTSQQMKMFLTRLGDHGRMAITGDITQTDLPSRQISGLREAQEILRPVREIQIFHFHADEVVRHPLVAKIIAAYDQRPSESR